MNARCVTGLVWSIASLFVTSAGLQAAPLNLSVSLPPIAPADTLTGLQFQANIVLVGNDVTKELIPSLQLTETQSYLRPGFSCSGGKGGGKCVPSVASLADTSSSPFAAYKPGDSLVGDFYFSLIAPESIDFMTALSNPINFGPYELQLFKVSGGSLIAPDATTASAFTGLSGGESYDLRFSTTSFSADGLTIAGTLKTDAALQPPPVTSVPPDGPLPPDGPVPPAAPTPEPSSLALFGTGVLFIGKAVTRRIARTAQ